MRLIYHPDAEAELIEFARFYERRVPSLSGQFLDAADLSVGAILDVPECWSIIDAGVRRYLMPRLADHLRILAFKHHSSDSDYWRYRLSE